MNIAFRTDSSLSIGTCHVHRCLNARKFKKKQINVIFLNDFSGNINNLVEKEFKIFTYPNKTLTIQIKNSIFLMQI